MTEIKPGTALVRTGRVDIKRRLEDLLREDPLPSDIIQLRRDAEHYGWDPVEYHTMLAGKKPDGGSP